MFEFVLVGELLLTLSILSGFIFLIIYLRSIYAQNRVFNGALVSLRIFVIWKIQNGVGAAIPQFVDTGRIFIFDVGVFLAVSWY